MSGAAGTALLVTVLAIRSAGLEAAGASPAEAELGGLQTAFLVASGIASVAIVLACFMQKTEAKLPTAQPVAH